jgi:hypothetical protein
MTLSFTRYARDHHELASAIRALIYTNNREEIGMDKHKMLMPNRRIFLIQCRSQLADGSSQT